MKTRVVLLTSFIWEAACALKALRARGLPVTEVLIQRPWWGRRSFLLADMRLFFFRFFARAVGDDIRSYESAEVLARRYGISVRRVETASSYLNTVNIADDVFVIVVGAPIIGSAIIERVEGRLINFHTGILPMYRGPYSEFWALLEGNPKEVGTTIHLVTSKVDAGPILAKRACPQITWDMTPREAHRLNVAQGCELLARTVEQYIAGNIIASPQGVGRYLRYPGKDVIHALASRIGKRVRVAFID